jgi:diacylglycerol kinase (ATP)
MSEWLVLINPHAGKGRTAEDRTRAALVASGIEARVVVCDGLDVLSHEIAEGIATGVDRFVAVGGDGTVNAVVNEILVHDWVTPPTLGVLPAGTGCDLLRTFGISQKLDEAVVHLLGDETYLIDIGLVSGEWGRRYFINVGDAGVIGAAARVSATISPRWGTMRYVAALLRSLPSFARGPVTVTAGSKTFSGDALAVVFANGQFFGGGFNIAPRATLVDGELDVQIITARKREALRLVPKAMRGLHLSDPAVRRMSVPEVRVESATPWPVEVDGEYIGNTPVVARVLPGRIALKI